MPKRRRSKQGKKRPHHFKRICGGLFALVCFLLICSICWDVILLTGRTDQNYEDAGEEAVLGFYDGRDIVAASPDNSAWIEKNIAHICGDNSFGQCDVQNWGRVCSVQLGNNHSMALTPDGKVLFAGSNEQGQCSLDLGGKKAVSIAAGPYASYAVLEDGTISSGGILPVDMSVLRQETDVLYAAASDTHVVLLHQDGTVTAYGENEYGECEVSDWKNIVMIDCGYEFTVGLDKYGQVYVTGNNQYGVMGMNGLNGMRFVAAGNNTCLCIDMDNTVRALGLNGKGQLNVSEWKNVRAAAAGYIHTIAVTQSGERLAVGSDSFGKLGR